jgi:hypothetical protein
MNRFINHKRLPVIMTVLLVGIVAFARLHDAAGQEATFSFVPHANAGHLGLDTLDPSVNGLDSDLTDRIESYVPGDLRLNDDWPTGTPPVFDEGITCQIDDKDGEYRIIDELPYGISGDVAGVPGTAEDVPCPNGIKTVARIVYFDSVDSRIRLLADQMQNVFNNWGVKDVRILGPNDFLRNHRGQLRLERNDMAYLGNFQKEMEEVATRADCCTEIFLFFIGHGNDEKGGALHTIRLRPKVPKESGGFKTLQGKVRTIALLKGVADAFAKKTCVPITAIDSSCYSGVSIHPYGRQNHLEKHLPADNNIRLITTADHDEPTCFATSSTVLITRFPFLDAIKSCMGFEDAPQPPHWSLADAFACIVQETNERAQKGPNKREQRPQVWPTYPH